MSAPEPHLVLRGLHKSFGPVAAVHDFSLDVARGSFTTLLGPSGCGKTTVLRMLAGFIEPDGGAIHIAGKDQHGLPPNRRGVGMVFQDYALFPHMSVRANVEYGLRMHGLAAANRAERSRAALELLDLLAVAARFPHELSGGQQQRVALGRVLALEPEVLLMDEPLSNLDAKLRVRLRAELKTIQRRLGITTLYVTHDQEEALSLSDQVVVMNAGRRQQSGAPQDVYHLPANAFVADFVGQANRLPVEVVGVDEAPGGERTVRVTALGRPLTLRLPDARTPGEGQKGVALLRPEQLGIVSTAASGELGGAPTTWTVDATVEDSGFFGAFSRYWLRVDGLEETWLVDVPGSAGSETLSSGSVLRLKLLTGLGSWLW
ncbi:MAG TPA: ABC transporter ATP-binding protein [Trueperaceae bacterium]|nr:ABC transporter ATP-binding protein [Trueperaceae bacterium]